MMEIKNLKWHFSDFAGKLILRMTLVAVLVVLMT